MKFDKSVYFAPNGQKYKWIGQYDANSLYPCVMKHNQPTGMGLYISPSGEFFKSELIKENPFRSGCSKKSLIYLDMMQNDPRFFENGKKILLQTFITHGEKKIEKWFLDGYAVVHGRKIGIDFHGCRFHFCPFECGVEKVPGDTRKQEEFRAKCLKRELDEYIVMHECQFDKLKYKISGNIYNFLFREKISAKEILDATIAGNFYGFVNVNIESPPAVYEKYSKLGLPFIFRNISLTEDYLCDTMKKLAQKNNRKLPSRQLCITYNAENVLLNTDLLIYYLKCGLQIKKVNYAIEYLPGEAFEGFVDNLTKMRIEASRLAEKGKSVESETKQMLAKMLLNSSYGKMSMNLERRENVTYCRDADLDVVMNHMDFKRKNQLSAEYDIDVYEIIKHKKSTFDKIPIQCAVTILQLAKLHMVKFAHFLFVHLEEGSFSLLYSDTDSLNMAFTGNLDDLVKPEKIKSWRELKYFWFVENNSPEEIRAPGKFKIEYMTETGVYIGLSSKCYLLEDENSKKFSAKGVPRSVVMNYEMFVRGLYHGNEKVFREVVSINYSSVRNVMVTKQSMRKIINSIYLKFQVDSNLNTLSSLKFKNKIC